MPNAALKRGLIALALAFLVPHEAHGQQPPSERVAESGPSIERRTSNQAADAENATGDTAPVNEEAPALRRHPCGEDPYCYQSEDLKAQQQMADATNSMVRATWFSVFISVFATLLLWRNLDEARKATRHAADAAKSAQASYEIAERELTEANRPRLVAHIAKIGIPADEEDMFKEHKIVVDFANVGERAGTLQAVYVDLIYQSEHQRREVVAPSGRIWESRTARNVCRAPIILPIGEGRPPVSLAYERSPKLSDFEIDDSEGRGRLYLVIYAEYRDHLQALREFGRTYLLYSRTTYRREGKVIPITGTEYDFDRPKK